MATPQWQPGKLYPPGSLVVPRSALPPGGANPVDDGGFESGTLDDWDYVTVGGTAVASVASSHAHTGAYAFYWPGAPGSGSEGGTECIATSKDVQPCDPGLLVTVSGWFKYNTTGDINGSRAQMRIQFYDSGMNPLPPVMGTLIKGDSNNNKYRNSTASAVAPSNAAFVAAQFWVTGRGGKGHVYADDISWNYSTPEPTPGLMYKATQAAAGYSGTTEPNWPPTLGDEVIDNEVIWEGVLMSRVVWQASPILKTGATEPAWPTTIGDTVADNTIAWSASDPRVTDENCPNTKVVCIAKFKVFAGAGDIVRYSATLDPTDWTSEKNAGYIGTGMNQNSANEVSVLNLYRADLMVMNATTFQRWQIDPDPALMDMLDTMEGIGSRYHLACVPVANDLFYLANKGVRTIGVTGATKNMAAGDVGLPVDDIIKELLADLRARNLAGDNEEPLGLYWPSSGQYWLSFNRIVPDSGGDDPGGPIYLCPSLEAGDEYAEVMVYTVAQTGQVGAWSRYVFPYRIDDWAQEGDDLYVRDGDTVYRIGEDVGACDAYEEGDGVTGLPFNGLIQWPWLDSGAPGLDKQMECFEVVGEGRGWFEFGYDQTAPGYFTTPYQVEPDTLPGTPVPMPLNAPSYSVRVRYDGWNPATGEGNKSWSLNAISMQFT